MRGRAQFSGGVPAAGRGAAGRGATGQQRPPPGTWEADTGAFRLPRDMIMNNQELGIKPNTCFACGSHTHTFWQKECQYFGTRLFPRKCRNCGVGGHQNSLCTAKKSGDVPKHKHTRSAQIEEVTEDTDEFDFMFSGN